MRVCVRACERVFRPVCFLPTSSYSYCTAPLHPIMPLAPRAGTRGTLEHSAIRTNSPAQRTDPAEAAPPGGGGRRRSPQPHRRPPCSLTAAAGLRSGPEGVRVATVRAFTPRVRWGEPTSAAPELPGGPGGGSPGSGGERARAAAPSHPGPELRVQLLSGIISWRRPQRAAISARSDTESKPWARGSSSRARLSHRGDPNPLRRLFSLFSGLRAPPRFPSSRESASERELQEMRKTRHPDETAQICARASVRGRV